MFPSLGFPFTLAVLLTGRWPFNKAARNFQGFTFTVFGTCSLLTMTLKAIARYFKVTRPSLHPQIYSKRNMSLSDCSVFNINPFPISLMFNDGFFFHPGKFICIYECDKLSRPNVSQHASAWDENHETLICHSPGVHMLLITAHRNRWS